MTYRAAGRAVRDVSRDCITGYSLATRGAVMAINDLLRRSAVYYWRRRFPTKLRAVVPVGQIVLSLGSKDRGAAAARARRVSVAFDALTFGIEARMAANEALTPEQVDQVLAAFRALVLAEREDYRANQVSPREIARLKLQNPDIFDEGDGDDDGREMDPDDCQSPCRGS